MIFLVKSAFQIFQILLIFLQVYFFLQHQSINVRFYLNLKLDKDFRIPIFFMEYVNICDNQAAKRLSVIIVHELFGWICVFEKSN